jgi:hypothetical protein
MQPGVYVLASSWVNTERLLHPGVLESEAVVRGRTASHTHKVSGSEQLSNRVFAVRASCGLPLNATMCDGSTMAQKQNGQSTDLSPVRWVCAHPEPAPPVDAVVSCAVPENQQSF